MTDPRTATSDPLSTIYAEPTNEELARGDSAAGASLMPAPRPRRRTGRRVGRVFAGIGVVGLVLGGAAYAVAPTHVSTASWDLAPGAVDNVTIDLPVGDVDITQSSDGGVHFSEDLRYRGAERKTLHNQDGKSLEIRSERAAGFGLTVGWDTKLKYKVALPKGAAITFRQSAGDGRLSGEFGKVSVRQSAGDLQAKDLKATSLDITISAGDVRLTDVTTPTLKLQQSAGDTRVRFASAPTLVDVKTSAGDVTLDLPGDVAYDVTERHSAGDVRVEVPTGRGTGHEIKIDMTAGDVRLHRA